MKVGFISLGCSKNLIDTEVAIGLFKDNHYEIVNNPNDAEILVVNTCGFIESAKEEAINTILEMTEYKKKKSKYISSSRSCWIIIKEKECIYTPFCFNLIE